MDFEFVRYEVSEGVAEVILNRPEKLNAFHLPMYREICGALEAAEGDDQARVILLRGEGRAFCAGRDFKYSAELQREESADAWRRSYRGTFRWTLLQNKIVIALVQGYAMGGGSALALGADITLAEPDAKIGYPEIKHAIAGKTMLWPWMLGRKKSIEVLCSGTYITAEEGERYGLVNRTVSAGTLLEEGRKLAQEVAGVVEGVPEIVKRIVNHATRQMIRTTTDDRRYDTDTAHWDAAGVAPSPWLLSALAARHSFLQSELPQW